MADIPYPSDERERLEALRSYNILNTAAEREFDDLAKLAAFICGAPISLITLVDEHRQWFKSKVGLDADEIERNISFCSYVVAQKGMLIVQDATRDPRFAENPFVVSDLKIRFYAGAPLMTTEGHALGTLCVLDSVSRDLSEEQRKALHILADQVMVRFDQRRLLNDLGRSVDELERSRNELRRSEEKYKSLVETVSDIVYLTDDQGRFVYINPIALMKFGFAENELLGKPYYEVIVPEYRREVMSFYFNQRKERTPVTYREVPVMMHDGDVRWVGQTVTILTDKDAIKGFHAVGTDITERKKIQELIERERTLLKGIIESIPDEVYVKDLENRFVLVNSACLRTWMGEGYTSTDQLIGKKDADLFRSSEARLYEEQERDIMRTGNPIINQLVDVRDPETGATMRSLLINKIPLRDASGAVIGIVGINRDVTPLAKAQEHIAHNERLLNEAQSIAKMGSWEFDIIHNHVSWSDELYAILGADPNEAPEDIKTYLKYVHPDDVPALRKAVTRAVYDGEPFTSEHRIVLRDGTIRHMWGSGKPVYDERGQMIMLRGIAQDVTEKMRIEKELRAAKETAEEAARTKAEFLATMSHEIRTPMNAVIGMTDLLWRSPLTKKQKEFVEIIRTSGETLLLLINDILDFSKMESGKMELEKAPLSIRRTIEAVYDVTAPRARAKGLELTYFLEPGAPETIVGDEIRLRQILINLVGNAIKFTEKGEVAVGVRGAKTGTGMCAVSVSVYDTGIGIPADKLERLFKSFTQVDSSTTRKYGGTGLGLAISARLAELMNGSIAVESKEEEGSVFTLTFITQSEPATEDSGERRASRSLLAGKRIFIAERNERRRSILSRLLKDFDMEVFPRARASEVLHDIELNVPFDLGMVDMTLHDMDGITLAERIRERRHKRALPLVLLTNGELADKSISAAKKLFTLQLTKPVKQSVLPDQLAGLLKPETGRARERTAGETERTDGEAALTLRILVAEDNEVNQKLAVALLSKLGYDADIAVNGKKVLEALGHNRYDVILLDIQMPVMDGFETAREIVAGYPVETRPIMIALTANAMEGDRDKCLAAGMHDYLSKPIRFDDLRATLTKWARELDKKTSKAEAQPRRAPRLDSFLASLEEDIGTEFLRDVIESFFETAPRHLEAIEEAVKTRDLSALRFRVHTLKGTCGTLGMKDESRLCEELEEGLETTAWEAMAGKAHAVISAVTRAMEELSAYWGKSRAAT